MPEQPDCKHERCPIRHLCRNDGSCISEQLDRDLEEFK